MKLLAVLFVVFVAFSPTQLGKHFWPSWSAVAGIRVDYLAPTVYVTDILLVLALLTWLCRGLMNKISEIKETKPLVYSSHLSQSSTYLIYLFILLVFLRSFFTPSPWLALYWLARYGQIFLVAWLTSQLLSLSPRLATVMMKTFFYASLAMIVIGFIQVVYGRSTNWLWLLGERRFTISTPGIAIISIFGHAVLRPYATFSHPNALGGWFSLLGSMFWVNNYRKTYPMFVCGVLLTASRSAIIATALSLFLALLPAFSQQSYFYSLLFASGSISERGVLAKSAWQMFVDQPWFGVGPGQFIPNLPDYLPSHIWLLQPVHNIFLLASAELGIIPLALVAGIGVGWWRRSRWGARQIKMLLPLGAVWLVTGMLDHYWVTSQQNRILLGILIGMLLSELKVKSQKFKVTVSNIK